MNSRGWEKYFTERDHEHHRLVGKKEPNGFGEKPALLLIDIYYNVLGLKREPLFESMKTWPGSTGLEGWEAVDKTAELVAITRANNITVIHVKDMQSVIKPWIHRKSQPSKLSDELRKKSFEIEVHSFPKFLAFLTFK